MSEATLVKQNFFGKDPIQWWIGQVTDPITGKWEKNLKRSSIGEGPGSFNYYKVRVRILGYHDCRDDLPDEDLPLALVMGPAHQAFGVNQNGESLGLEGGETVVGFFLDGEDAQQPVVFGTLFRNDDIVDKISYEEVRSQQKICFKPWSPGSASGRKDGQHEIPASKSGVADAPKVGGLTFETGGLFDKSIAYAQTELASDFDTTIPSPCENNKISEVTKNIQDLVDRIQGFQQILDVYVDPIMGKIVNIDKEIKAAVSNIHGILTYIIRKSRAWLIQTIMTKLATLLNNIIPKPLQPSTGNAIQKLADIMFCVFEKIIKSLLQYLLDSIQNLVTQVIDFGVCAIESFLGDMMGQIFNVIDNSVGAIITQIQGVFGNVIGSVNSIIQESLKVAGLFLSILDCDTMKCPAPTNWSSRYGPAQSDVDNFNNILTKASLSSLTNSYLDTLDDAIFPDVTGGSSPNCSTNIFRCGPPSVSFLGGGGSGASGQTIINALGQIIGVDITNPGSGYVNPPLVSFYDSCKNGYGAGAIAILGPVSGGSDNQEYTPPLPGGANSTNGQGDDDTEKDFGTNYDGTCCVKLSLPDGNGNVYTNAYIEWNEPVTPQTYASLGGDATKFKENSFGKQTLVIDGFVRNDRFDLMEYPDETGRFPTYSEVANKINEYYVDITRKPADKTAVNFYLDKWNEGYWVEYKSLRNGGFFSGFRALKESIFAGTFGGLKRYRFDLIKDDPNYAGVGEMPTKNNEYFINFILGKGIKSAKNACGQVLSESIPCGISYQDDQGETFGVIKVVMIEPGENFLSTTTETDEFGNVKEVDGDSDNFVSEIEDVYIKDTGYGYDENTTITVLNCSGEVDTSGSLIEVQVVNGFIVKAKVLNSGSNFTCIPKILINSDTGQGAELIPIMKFTRLGESSVATLPTGVDAAARAGIITIVDCVQK